MAAARSASNSSSTKQPPNLGGRRRRTRRGEAVLDGNGVRMKKGEGEKTSLGRRRRGRLEPTGRFKEEEEGQYGPHTQKRALTVGPET